MMFTGWWRDENWCWAALTFSIKRYSGLSVLNYDDLKAAQHKWVESAIQTDNSDKAKKWTQSVAVGSKSFILTLETWSSGPGQR